jgi:hypothetical protein
MISLLKIKFKIRWGDPVRVGKNLPVDFLIEDNHPWNEFLKRSQE